ncbi:DNA -binding domain-containing protein [Rhodoplanes sp. SY1]|uniref:DNA -binding domain-containing protein n=1 Tax=Rhodoplanes sp. SY1 TaxID=3166646 RepID=UPI0038B6619E
MRDGTHAYRAIAAGLFGDARVPKGRAWKTHDLRDRTIRLVRSGTRLMRGGYLDLLLVLSR